MQLWQAYSSQIDLISIYTGHYIENFDIDHFIPWSFVTHDQLWNLAPIEKSLNSSKSNKLPGQNLVRTFS